MQQRVVSSTYWISDSKPLGFTTIHGSDYCLECVLRHAGLELEQICMLMDCNLSTKPAAGSIRNTRPKLHPRSSLACLRSPSRSRCLDCFRGEVPCRYSSPGRAKAIAGTCRLSASGAGLQTAARCVQSNPG